MAPSMASMLARAASSASAACRASRAAASASARAARSAAAARRAPAAVSRAAHSSTDAAAAADLTSDTTTSSREARSLRCDASRGAAPSSRRLRHGSDSTHSDGCLYPDNEKKPQAPEFVADEKDLESDEALWALYERWCKHFNQERDRDEMARRFNEFKRVVLFVHQENNSDSPNRLTINKLTDGKLPELYGLGRYNAFKQKEFAAKLPKIDAWYIWMDGKYYMELPEEFQPE